MRTHSVLTPTLVLALTLASGTIAAGEAKGATPSRRLARSTPEAQGVPSSAILEFLNAADERIDSMNSFMLVRHGNVIAEAWWAPFAADDAHMLYSLSKSFTSTAVGLAIAEGKLSLDDTVISFFPVETPSEPSRNLKDMRVRDLLRMSSGQHADVVASLDWSSPVPLTRQFLAAPVAHKPGTHFVYNSQGTYMLSAIVQKATGENLVDYLQPRLFAPLGMGTPRWDQSAQGIAIGASGLHLRTEDIACFGQLYLQKGNWHGIQLVPASWVEAATSLQTANGSNPKGDWDQGYGYQFWRCRPGCYRGDGAFGQFCIVVSQRDAVIAITSGGNDMQAVMNLVWDKILPALGDAKIEANHADQQGLQDRIASLAVHGPTNAAATSAQAARFVGRTYTFPENERNLTSLTLQSVDGQTSLIMRGGGYDEKPIVIDHGAWRRDGTSRFGSDFNPGNRELRDEAVAAVGGWETPDTFVAKLCYHETPYMLSLRLEFGGDLVVFNGHYNVAFGNNDFPELVGRAE